MAENLIDRLEKATGPDRELDVAIAFAIGRVRERDGNYLYATGNDSDMVVEPNEYDDHIVAQPLGYYTRSLDAAATLVPEKAAAWRVGRGDVSWAVVSEGYRDSDKDHTVQAATPAIALCVAALKARSELLTAD